MPGVSPVVPRAFGIAEPRAGAPLPYQPIVTQVAGINERLEARVGLQEALLEAILARMATPTNPTSAPMMAHQHGVHVGMPGGLLAPATFMDSPATSTLTQVAAAGPTLPAASLLVLGGAQPTGYVYVGANQGLAVWGHADIVSASIMDGGEAGNV